MSDRDGGSPPSGFEGHAVALLGRFAEEGGRDFDANLASEAAARSVRRFPGDPSSTWTDRMSEAARDFGLRLRVLELTPPETCGRVREMGLLAAWSPSAGRFVLAGPEGVEDPGVDGGRRPLEPSALASILGVEAGARIRWVWCAPAYPAQALSGEEHGPGPGSGAAAPTPWRRLKGLLKGEASVIRSLIAFSLGVGVFTLAVPLAVDALISAVAFGGLIQPVLVLSAVLLAALLLQGGLQAYQVYLAEVIQRRIFVRLATDLAYRLPRVRMEAHDHHYGPELVNRFFDVTVVQKASAMILLDGINVVLGALIGLAVLSFYHPLLLAFALVLVGCITALIFWPAGRAVRLAIAESRVKYEIAGWLEDIARYPVSFMAAGGRRLAEERLDALALKWLGARKGHFRVLMLQTCGGLAFKALAATFLLALGGVLVIEGTLSLGQLVAAELIVTGVLASIAKLGKHLESVYDIMAAVDKLGHLTDLPLETRGGEVPVPPDRPGAAAVTVEGLQYGYTPDRPILRGLSFDLPPGTRAALSGTSGAGASTLLQILFGLREPEAGQVRIDGFNLHEWNPEVLRGRSALAADIEIIEGTLLDNVRFGRADLSVAQVREALEVAGLWKVVRAFPEGLYTRLSPWGDPLSDTQTRLLMIARAVARKPRLLLVDGLLDTLDPATRDEVASRLLDRVRDWTVVLKTRMDDLVRRCDRTIDLTPRDPEAARASS